MTEQAVADRVRKIMVDHLGVELRRVTDEASIMDDLDADSLDLVELVMAYEEEFDIEVRDEEAEDLLTVADVIKHVQKLTGAR